LSQLKLNRTVSWLVGFAGEIGFDDTNLTFWKRFWKQTCLGSSQSRKRWLQTYIEGLQLVDGTLQKQRMEHHTM
jgi:hypothetical protein